MLKKFGIIVILSLLSNSFGVKVSPLINIGEPAPIFMLPDLNNKRVSLRDFAGKLRNPWKNKKQHIVILSFMATYCVPCRHEIPQLEAFSKEASNDIKVIYISVDSLGKEILKPFKEKMGITNTILNDKYGKIMQKYGVKKLPSLFIIDKKGKLRFQSLNGLPSDLDLKDALNKKISHIRGGSTPSIGGVPKVDNNIAKQGKSLIVQDFFNKKSEEEILKKYNISKEQFLKIKNEALAIITGEWNK